MAIELHPLLEPYYTETEPDLRKNKLDAYSSTSDTKADQYRKDLYACRHIDKKHPEKSIDRFLFHLISLATIAKNTGTLSAAILPPATILPMAEHCWE